MRQPWYLSDEEDTDYARYFAADLSNPPDDVPIDIAIRRHQNRIKLFTAGNPKTLKGMKRGYFPLVLMLAPSDRSGFQVCAFRTPGCEFSCLNTAGMVKGGQPLSPDQVFNKVQEARRRRTLWLFKNEKRSTMTPHPPQDFWQKLFAEIDAHLSFCANWGFKPCFRLNGTSDLIWERIPYGHTNATIFSAYSDQIFYDYTKIPARFRRPKNYYLNYSWNEDPQAKKRANEYIAHGVNPCIVFDTVKGHPLPKSFGGFRVIDGDDTDLRFLDPQNVAVGLRAKGYAKRDTTGFVIRGARRNSPAAQDTFDFEDDSGGNLFPDVE